MWRPVARPITSPIAQGVGARVSGGALPNISALTAVACGNSITTASKFMTDHWNWTAEVHVANVLSGSPLRFKVVTPTTRTDQYGVYGFSGQRLDAINADIAVQWIAPINTAGVVPQVVVGLSLLENDLIQASTVPDMISRLTTWISTVQAAWPLARLVICTPRPTTGYNTPQIVANYQAIRDYILTLANNRTIFTARVDTYEDPANPGLPLAGYTSDGIHPNTRGSVVNSRVIAAAYRRIGVLVASDTINSNNRTLTGSVAATGTNVTGTRPTGTGTGGTASGTTISTALNPGWRMEIAGSLGDFNVFANCPLIAVAGAPALVSAYTVIRLGSGAENLRAIQVDPRLLDGSGNTFRKYLSVATLDADMDFFAGDVLTFVEPPHAPLSGSITQVTNFLTAKMKATASPAIFEVVEHGWMTVT